MIIFIFLSIIGINQGFAAQKNSDHPILMVIGDSLTAGYGLTASAGFVPRLEAALKNAGYNITVLNAGVSGDTTAGGRARLDWNLMSKPNAVLLALGANDALRGIAPTTSEANLDAMLRVMADRHIPVMLIGMKAPPNLGKDYAVAFEEIYPRLANRYKIPLYPFFLEGVAAVPTLNQTDGIHPNAKGVDEMVHRMLPAVVKFISTLS